MAANFLYSKERIIISQKVFPHMVGRSLQKSPLFFPPPFFPPFFIYIFYLYFLFIFIFYIVGWCARKKARALFHSPDDSHGGKTEILGIPLLACPPPVVLA